MMKIGWIFLIISAVGDFAVPYILAPFYHGYSHTRQVMSVLGNPKSPVRRWYNEWLVLLGIGLLASFPSLIDAYWKALEKKSGGSVCRFYVCAVCCNQYSKNDGGIRYGEPL